MSGNFELSLINEFLLIFYLNQNGYCNDIATDSKDLQLLLNELALVLLSTYMYDNKINKYNSLLFMIIVIFFMQYLHPPTKIIKLIVTQIINFIYFNNNRLTTKKYFEKSFGRHIIRILYFGLPKK